MAFLESHMIGLPSGNNGQPRQPLRHLLSYIAHEPIVQIVEIALPGLWCRSLPVRLRHSDIASLGLASVFRQKTTAWALFTTTMHH